MSSTDSLLSRCVAFFVKHSRLLLLLGILAILPAVVISRDLQLDRSIESLYAPDDPHLQDFQQSRHIFGGDEFVIIAFTDPELIHEDEEGYRDLSTASTQRIEWFTQKLEQIAGIQPGSIQDLARSSKPRKITFEFRDEEFTKVILIPSDKLYAMLTDFLISKNQQTTAIVVRLLPEQHAPDSRRAAIRQIRTVAAQFTAKYKIPVYVAGEPDQVQDMFLFIEQDGQTLFLVALFLLGLVLLIRFRNIRWVLLAILVVIFAITLTETILVFSQVRLTMVSSMLNSLVTIIGIATVTHVTVRYREHRQTEERVAAFQSTFQELLPAIFWSCATTGVGFFALTSSDITPVKSFGLMMALAAGLVFVASVLLLPGGTLVGRWKTPPRQAPAEQSLSRLLAWLAGCIEHRPRIVAASGLLLMLVAGWGFRSLHVETDFSKNFSESSPIIQSLNFIEQELGGAGSWEINFPAPEKLTIKYLDSVRILSKRLRTEVNQPDDVRLTKILCMTDGIDPIPRMPIVTNTLTKRLRVLNQLQPEFGSSLYNPQKKRMRIMLRSIERQPAGEKLKLINQVQHIADDWAETHLQKDFPNAQVHTTGLFVLLAYLIDNLLADQLLSFLLAGCGIVIMMTVAFRSLSLGLISLVPNLFPILLVIGGMGWFGLPVNIATAMIASVSLGLTVDSSIHYLTEFQQARRSCTVMEAIFATHQRVGRSLVFANLALITGFSVLTLSHFIPLVYFGILVSLSMLGGLLGNLLLLPVLLKLTQRDVAQIGS